LKLEHNAQLKHASCSGRAFIYLLEDFSSNDQRIPIRLTTMISSLLFISKFVMRETGLEFRSHRG